MEPLILYPTLLLVGFVLIGMEIFLPGGVVGILGSMAWIAAAVVGGTNFPAPWNVASVVALLFAGALTFVVWVKYFPKSRVGKSLSLQENSRAYKANARGDAVAVGTVGEALTTLRPSGIARFDGKRVDVVADGEWIEAGTAIKAKSISSGHVLVVAITPETTE